MANLQVKGMDEGLYGDLKRLAAEESRSLSQQVVVMLREYLTKRPQLLRARPPAQVLLDLAGSWEDERPPEEIVQELHAARTPSHKLSDGF